MKNTVIVLVVVAVLAAGGWYYMNMSQTSTDSAQVEIGMPAPGSEGVNEMEVVSETGGTVKEFTVDGKNFSFTPELVSVKKGDTVRIKFVNSQGFHDFVIDEFKVATPQIKEGEAVVEFVADKAGSFEYYCSVGSHRAMGMKGTLQVTE
ncbi:cupredoxin domain-containing protein [Patescibacteria group bacterium]|nr:cupredoxin domain-containing protein [Patescibacteria group bacterium]